MKKRNKSIPISALVGLIVSLPLFTLLSVLSISIFADILFFPFFPWSRHLGEGGIILFYLVPIYGAIAGGSIAYIISSLTKKYKKKKSIFKKGGFYFLILILIWMMISLTQPLEGTSSDSFNEPSFYNEFVCKWVQGCISYGESKFCSDNSALYPKTPINQLPDETLYFCEHYENPEVTREELVNGEDCVFVNKRGETNYYTPFMHPVYEGYSVIGDKIYIEYTKPGKVFCGYVEKIRYRSTCGCGN